MPRAYPRLLVGSPRWLLGLVVILAAAEVAVAVVPGLAGLMGDQVADSVQRGLVLSLQVATGALLLWRVRMVPLERALWQRLAGSAAVLSLAVVTSTVLASLAVTREFAQLPMTWAPAVIFPLIYGGLVGWNRYSTSVADPNDTINGVSAVLAVTAVANTVLAHVGDHLTGSQWWQLQGLLAQSAASFVILGTALSVAFIAAITRDPRPWLLVGGFVLEFTAATVGAITEDVRLGWAGTAVAITCICVAACLRPPPITPQPTDPAATTIGAFVVIISSVAVLIVSVFGLHSALGAWCAGAAATGSCIRLLLNVRDLSQLAVTRKEALTDELTGLANRRAMLRRLEELTDAGRPLVFGLLDLNKFKEVNDGLGHAAGDDLLRLVAQRIEPLLNNGDLLARLGGDEFAVVAHVPARIPAPDRAAWLGDRLRTWLSAPFQVGGLDLHATAAIGLTHTHNGAGESGLNPTQLLQQADTAMYYAKRSGAGVAVFDPLKHIDNSGQLALVEELRTALGTGQLVLHYQPQVNITTGLTVGVEALVRWQHPTRGLLLPAEFIALAELHGLMGALTRSVLAQAVAQTARWRRQGLDLRMSVNLSASNLLDINLPDQVRRLLQTHRVPASAMVLEVTETVLMSDPDLSLAVVGALADLGTTVSIDDFGTGYASLTYLRDLPVAELKLDRSFTADLLTDPRTTAIVASTIELAHRLGLRVVAEGVEQPATFSGLKALGCDESQGYLHSAALPPDQFTDWLTTQQARQPVEALH